MVLGDRQLAGLVLLLMSNYIVHIHEENSKVLLLNTFATHVYM